MFIFINLDIKLTIQFLNFCLFVCYFLLNPMEGKLFLGRYLIWVMLMLGQLHGSKSCIEKERMALLELKKYIISRSGKGESNIFFSNWTNDIKSDCCLWEGVTLSAIVQADGLSRFPLVNLLS